MRPENQTPASALMFAAGAHYAVGQKRKYTGEDYIVHPEAVMETVALAGYCTREMRMAAALHDVVEDTGVTLATIVQLFGVQVARLVEQVTDVSVPSDGNRKVRRAIDKAHTAQATPEGKTLKLADVICNLKNLVELADASFAALYLEEKRSLLEVLKEGDPYLFSIAHNHVQVGLQQLKEIK